MKLKTLNPILLLSLTLAVSACRYSNTFNGTFNQNPATLTAFSKNTDKYCISLNLTSGSETRKSFISANPVFDSTDLTRTKFFNTKNEPCSANLDEYLVGNRSTKIVGTSMTSRTESLNSFLCQIVYYTVYAYTDLIQFEFKNKLSDLSTGTFTGTGGMETYTDFRRPVSYGPVYRCNGANPYPNPYPYPYPYPPYPRLGGPVGY
jgi:hypothetical protein